MVFIFGIHTRRGTQPVNPRFISDLHGDVRVGDLVEVVGSCPRAEGDRCDLVGGHASVVIAYNGSLYYKIVP